MLQDRLRINLTDDDVDDRLFFEEAINDLKMNTELTAFCHGAELMEFLNANLANKPDLIFLDLNMPIMNGMECLQQIKSSPLLKDIVVAIYSTSSSEKDIEDTFIKGADIYLTKPSSFTELKNAIQRVLKMNWQYHTSSLNKENFLLRV